MADDRIRRDQDALDIENDLIDEETGGVAELPADADIDDEDDDEDEDIEDDE
jgi:hypothetical protein